MPPQNVRKTFISHEGHVYMLHFWHFVLCNYDSGYFDPFSKSTNLVRVTLLLFFCNYSLLDVSEFLMKMAI